MNTRFRDLGFTVGELPLGPLNAISDVAGVAVGHCDISEGALHTGLTLILPHSGDLFQQKVPAAVATINGFGKATGFEQVRELGQIETPIALTNTRLVGRLWDQLVAYTLSRNPEAQSVSALVAECNDSFLNDIRYTGPDLMHRVSLDIALDEALATLGTGVAEGCVGAGMGTACYGFKGGIGTASRIVRLKPELSPPLRVGALIQTNFGRREELRILGAPVGLHLREELLPERGADPGAQGSVIVVLATDAPLSARQLGRLAKRAVFGLARTGTIAHHGSGDFVVAFSTALDTAPLSHDLEAQLINGLFQAVVESVEEAVYNALVAAHSLYGHEGRVLHALPHERLIQILRQHQM